MPKGVYKRTEKHLQQIHENIQKMAKLPRTQKQIQASRENGYKAGKLPKTQKQRITARENGCKCALKTKGKSWTNIIVCHHNDLCHAAERPKDVTYMIHSEHNRLQANLRVRDGTHNFLPGNRTDAMP